MTANRFFIPPENFKDGTVSFPADLQSRIGRVLRLKPGDEVEALDDRGKSYRVGLDHNPDGSWSGRILSVQPVGSEPRVRITLYVGLTQREKMEWILQKGTEVGVASFQPFISRRTLVRQPGKEEKRQTRWITILREAAEQSGRGCIPELFPTVRFEDAVNASVANNDLSVVAWEEEQDQGLHSLLEGRHPASVGLFCGPEGGFDASEIELMRSRGLGSFSLGRRILRMETAAILAPALVLYALGELDILEQSGREHIL
jgi:16S rRNA (uracil1498-N3)-methyltransferase